MRLPAAALCACRIADAWPRWCGSWPSLWCGMCRTLDQCQSDSTGGRNCKTSCCRGRLGEGALHARWRTLHVSAVRNRPPPLGIHPAFLLRARLHRRLQLGSVSSCLHAARQQALQPGHCASQLMYCMNRAASACKWGSMASMLTVLSRQSAAAARCCRTDLLVLPCLLH